ncbi:zinc finger and BTB domain-containing protein 18.3 [Malaya genurostris]|uniref:zinc finger and BTB domain-containing protein 18.3 n=1 Tax=Malaya genurostris TaxID=325434 RepID=UPI0026F383D4|nr:zinc finger and BTB domain-containing protein 18.3 [Malaya genurostris]XP_058443475.1 zinc finger and BTB domain-containing protein 18.3 [Malaya genurostris]XP_058443476.1 zinc finger and BTB domain-containing protein 18.3 [Malaya genurostris]
MLPQQYCLRWKYHHSNLQTMFSQLLDRGCFCDVTLACEGQTIRAHRVVLCACSTYFDQLLTNCSTTEKDPIIIMRDAKFEDIKCLIEFMYKGEINVEHGSLASLLKTAEELRIKGLAEVSWRDEENCSSTGSDTSANNNNSLSLKNVNPSVASNNNNNSIKIVETKKLLAPQHNLSSSSMTPLTVSSLESRISDSPNLPLLTPLAAGSPRNPINCASPINYFGNKKKRGRPPLDEEYDTFQQLPKISHVEGGAGSSTPFTSSSQLVAVMMDDSSNEQTIRDDNHHLHHQQQQQQQHHSALSSAAAAYLEQQSRTVPPDGLQGMDFDEDTHIPRKLIPKLERPDTPQDYLSNIGAKFEYDDQSPPSPNDQSNAVFLTAQEQEEWKDVIKMNDYLTKGRRPQFWEEPFTKRVMDGIKNKTLEMKKAAKLLGVSYGTLYGRYRETYGCLKHPYRGPFMAASRINNMWPTASDGASVGTTTDIMTMLQRGIISLPRAAELMHTTPSTISSYLEQLQEVTAQTDHDHMTGMGASSVNNAGPEDDRTLQQMPALSLMSSHAESQLRVKPEISISALKRSSPSSSASSAAAGSSSSSALSAMASTSTAAQLSTNT